MNKELKSSMKPVASFSFKNLSTTEQVKLCLFPGHFDTTEIVKVDDKIAVAFSNPAGITAAGYQCQQVADDYNATVTNVKADGTYKVQILPKSKRTRYRDFLNYIKYSGLKVSKMRITDLNTNGAHEIFGQEIEVSASAIGQKSGSDFIQLSAHRDSSAYDQTYIDVDLASSNLLLDETTLAFLEVPAGASFQIDFTLEKMD